MVIALNEEISSVNQRCKLEVITESSTIEGPAILSYLNLPRYCNYQLINYFNPSNLTNYGIFVGPDDHNCYYLWEFTQSEIGKFVDICTEFNTDPRQYCYGPAFDRNYHLYHLTGETYYRGYDYWPRDENRYIYNTEGEVITERTAFSRPLYPLTESEQDKLYQQDMESLPTWKTATNDQGRYDTTIGRDDYSPHTGDSVNLRGSVNRTDIELSEM
jgi:hypothetical protein